MLPKHDSGKTAVHRFTAILSLCYAEMQSCVVPKRSKRSKSTVARGNVREKLEERGWDAKHLDMYVGRPMGMLLDNPSLRPAVDFMLKAVYDLEARPNVTRSRSSMHYTQALASNRTLWPGVFFDSPDRRRPPALCAQVFLHATIGANYTGPGGELLRQDTVCSPALWGCPCDDIIEALQHALTHYKATSRTLSTAEIVHIAKKRQRDRAEAAAAAEEAAAAGAATDEQAVPGGVPFTAAHTASSPPSVNAAAAAAGSAGSASDADQLLVRRQRPSVGAMNEDATHVMDSGGGQTSDVIDNLGGGIDYAEDVEKWRAAEARIVEKEAALGYVRDECGICLERPLFGVKISGTECRCTVMYCERCIVVHGKHESMRGKQPRCPSCREEFGLKNLKIVNMTRQWAAEIKYCRSVGPC